MYKDCEAPEKDRPILRFGFDIDAMKETSPEAPPTVSQQVKTRFSACYFMGNTSGKGVGLVAQGGPGID